MDSTARMHCCDYVSITKSPEKPPCLRLKRFLEEGDSIYDQFHYYCFDCKRIWSYTNCMQDKFPYWEVETLEQLDKPDQWIGWMGYDGYPPDAFANGMEGFEQWVLQLKEAIDVTKPI